MQMDGDGAKVDRRKTTRGPATKYDIKTKNTQPMVGILVVLKSGDEREQGENRIE